MGLQVALEQRAKTLAPSHPPIRFRGPQGGAWSLPFLCDVLQIGNEPVQFHPRVENELGKPVSEQQWEVGAGAHGFWSHSRPETISLPAPEKELATRRTICLFPSHHKLPKIAYPSLV